MRARRTLVALAALPIAVAAAACSSDDTTTGASRSWSTTDPSGTAPEPGPPGTATTPDASVPLAPNLVPPPRFSTTITQANPPPPVSGGTLLVARDGQTAVAADPDRDAVYVVDLPSRAVTAIPLQPGDEPGRLAEDGDRRVHVALRSGGAVATIDLATKAVIGRQSVCVAPRGVAYDASDDTVYVACESGELVQLAAAGGPPLRSTILSRDLRDIVDDGDHLLVSRFRSATVLHVAKASLAVDQTDSLPASEEGATPAVAWRMVAMPGGGALLVHQRGQSSTPVPVAQGGYSGGDSTCDRSIVEGALSVVGGAQGPASSPALSDAVVPVDVAVGSPAGGIPEVVVVATGNAMTPGLPQILDTSVAQALPSPDAGPAAPPLGCIFSAGTFTAQPAGQATAVAFDGQGFVVVQTREPAALFLPNFRVTIPLSSVSRDDTGQDIFDSNSGSSIACASCHAEGGDDGRVWTFEGLGQRRTPSLRGTVTGTAPYHWGGEERDFPELVHDVYSGRMSGPELDPGQLAALTAWVLAIPAPPAPPPTDAASAARGGALFHGSAGCSGCHSGPRLTDNATVDVGTGGSFQVPPLVGVAYRAPFLHMGCAATLFDRFTCGGTHHGNTSALSQGDIADLVAYLGTL